MSNKSNNKRNVALKWWNNLTLEEKCYKTIKANHLIIGDHTRHPNTLTDKEIETIHYYTHGKINNDEQVPKGQLNL